MQIIFSEDSFHEMSKPVLWKKNKKTVIKLSSAELAQRVVKVQMDLESDKVLSLHYFFGLSITIFLYFFIFISFLFLFFFYFFFIYFFFIYFFYIILDAYNGLNLPFQLVSYSHLFCF